MVLQKQLKRFYVSERGFTLVELLIVVAIIAILAAIAIPRFTIYLEKAYRASMLSDAKNISTQLETYYGDNFTYVTAVNSVGPGPATTFLDGGTGYLVNASSGNSVTITGAATTYTIVIANPKLSGGKSPLSYAVNGAITCTWADGSGC